jgi:hypothetical protein
VSYSFRRWQDEGVWDEALKVLDMQMRVQQGRDPEPSAAIIDSQWERVTPVRGPEKGYEAGKKSPGANATCLWIPRATCWESGSWQPVVQMHKERERSWSH